MSKTYPTEWNFDLLHPEGALNQDWLAATLKENQQAVKDFAEQWQSDQSYLTDPSQLKAALSSYQDIQATLGFNSWQTYYYSLKWQTNQLDDQLKATMRVAEEKAIELYNQLQFFPLTLAKISSDQQTVFLQAEELADFHYFLSRLFAEQQYLLSEPEEKILNLVAQPASGAWVEMTEGFLAKQLRPVTNDQGKQDEQPLPVLMSLIDSQQKSVRDEAATQIDAIMSELAPVATEEMNAILSFKKINDDLRGFTRPDAARHLSDGVDTAMVDAMLEAVRDKYATAQRYYKLKAALFGQATLAYHERNVPYGSIAGQYNLADSTDLVIKVLTNLDSQFGQIATDFFTRGQVDALPRHGKTDGAFCAHGLLNQPTFILLNHTNALRDVLTMAHELGHGINNELSRQAQSALNFGTSLATAEVASTFMEDFVLEELVKEADQQTKLAIMMMKLNDDVSSIFRQVACYSFEQSLHAAHRQAGYVPSEEIGSLFQQMMVEYMGPAVTQTGRAADWWVYWSHIRNPFYVYSYASGLLISKSLQTMVRQDSSVIADIKQFLAAGESDSPVAIFAKIGLDIAHPDFWMTGLDSIDLHLSEAEELATQLSLI